MSTFILSSAWIGLLALGVAIGTAVWHMRKCIPPNMDPVDQQLDRNHSRALLIARHDAAMDAFESWLYRNGAWATTSSERAQHLLLAAIGPLEAYCYECRRAGELDEFYETRLFFLMNTLEHDTDFSTMSSADDSW